MLAQAEYQPIPITVQVALLLAVDEGKLDDLPLDLMPRFKAELGPWLHQHCPNVEARIAETAELSNDDRHDLGAALDGLVAWLSTPAGEGA